MFYIILSMVILKGQNIFYSDCVALIFNSNDLIGMFTHLKVCLADAIHNFK